MVIVDRYFGGIVLEGGPKEVGGELPERALPAVKAVVCEISNIKMHFVRGQLHVPRTVHRSADSYTYPNSDCWRAMGETHQALKPLTTVS